MLGIGATKMELVYLIESIRYPFFALGVCDGVKRLVTFTSPKLLKFTSEDDASWYLKKFIQDSENYHIMEHGYF